jgi:membrane protein implicated in regulation of membrane protease activity
MTQIANAAAAFVRDWMAFLAVYAIAFMGAALLTGRPPRAAILSWLTTAWWAIPFLVASTVCGTVLLRQAERWRRKTAGRRGGTGTVSHHPTERKTRRS